MNHEAFRFFHRQKREMKEVPGSERVGERVSPMKSPSPLSFKDLKGSFHLSSHAAQAQLKVTSSSGAQRSVKLLCDVLSVTSINLVITGPPCTVRRPFLTGLHLAIQIRRSIISVSHPNYFPPGIICFRLCKGPSLPILSVTNAHQRH